MCLTKFTKLFGNCQERGNELDINIFSYQKKEQLI